jgi:hypothetical protein
MWLFSKKSSPSTQSSLKKESNFDKVMKRKLWIMIVTAIITMGVFTYFIIAYFSRLSTYNAEKETRLLQTSSYASVLDLDGSIDQNTLTDIVDDLVAKQDETITINNYLNTLRIPFESFLRYVYLPSLNIWQDPYTNEIDTSLVGGDFLAQNPYTDIAQIQQWTSFFKNMGSVYNEITSINVGAVVESDPFFYTPIKVSFVAPTRRAFLFLIDKLSLTSDKTNIMLLNEFFYHFWSQVRNVSDLDAQMQTILNEQQVVWEINDETRDSVLGYLLMQWKNDKIDSLPFVTNELLAQTVRDASWCDDRDNDETCRFLFREKFRTVPRLAYTLGYSSQTPASFQEFIVNIPPLLVIDTFTFDKNFDTNLGAETSYVGEVSLKVYGYGISTDEVDHIASALGQSCFVDGTLMSVTEAQKRISQTLLAQGDPGVVSSQRSKDLLEMQEIMSDMATKYEGLSSYKKVTRLFEVYRMLYDSSLCD